MSGRIICDILTMSEIVYGESRNLRFNILALYQLYRTFNSNVFPNKLEAALKL